MKVKEEERKREETHRVEKHILEMAKQQEETNRSNEYNIVDKTAKSLHEYILKALRMPGFRNGDSARSFEVDSYYDAWDDILRNFFTLDPNKDEDIEKVVKFKELVESAHTLEISDYNYDDKTLKMRVEIPKRKKTLKYDITFKYSLGSGRFAKFNDIIIELSEDM